MTENYLAHSQNHAGFSEPLRLHLETVAHRAAGYASAFGAEKEAFAAGILHDAGKYGELFQRRLKGLERKIDHWSPGAWLALTRYKQSGVATTMSTAAFQTETLMA